MTTKPRARKFRIRRSDPLSVTPARPAPVANDPAADAPAPPVPADVDSPAVAAADTDIAALRREGLTGRQLRMARRVAQKHGLAVTSDFDAVRQLRGRGIDPFQRSNILELVVPNTDGSGAPTVGADADTRVQLPQTVPAKGTNLPSTQRADPGLVRAREIADIQRGMTRRRRRKSLLLMARLAVFVVLPTVLAGWYFYVMATPMYATYSEFVVEQAESQGAAGMGGLFQGSSMATQRDSGTVQSFLQSREAYRRLDEEYGFKAHFSQDFIDPIQRLPEDATDEAGYRAYQEHVKITYDPTEGIIRMEVVAAEPAVGQTFAEALIGYAEEQVDQLTERVRGDQMDGARESYDEAEARRAAALTELLAIQQEAQQIDPVGETAARVQQISALEQQRQQLQVSLSQRLSVARPNQAQVGALESQIAGIDTLISDLRADMTDMGDDSRSLATNNTELRLAEENYTFQTLLVQQALQQMEAARIEANRQVRYLSIGVEPVAPDEAAYPKAFENTALAFLILCGVYLMISLTASVLREQVTN